MNPRDIRLLLWSFAVALALVVSLSAPAAFGQSPLLVRACPSPTSSTGFGGCPNSVWAVPATSLIVDVQRSGSDIWITPSQLAAGDRVFACTDPTVTPGPFVACPSFLPGQTNNYLAATAIPFGPPVTNGTLRLSWQAVTTDNQSPPAPISQPVSYQVFVRGNDCAGATGNCQTVYPATPSADTAAVFTTLSEPAGAYCAVVGAYFSGYPATLGPLSNESCVTVVAGKITPAKVAGVVISGK